MSKRTEGKVMGQQDLFETEAARSLLDQLLADSRLYTQSKDYKELLDFVVRLRNFAPFNAMLLQVQISRTVPLMKSSLSPSFL